MKKTAIMMKKALWGMAGCLLALCACNETPSGYRVEGVLQDSTFDGRTIYIRQRDNRTNISYYLEHNVAWRGLTASVGVMANRNTALDVLESESRETRRMVSIDDGNVNVSELDSLEDSPTSALEDMIKSEDEASLRAGVEGLPELYREVAFKRLIDGLSYKAIADELGLELNTVRTRIRRAKALLENLNGDAED